MNGSDEGFIEQSAKMFEKEYNLWFSAQYKTQIAKLTTAEAIELRSKLKPAFICGLHVGLTGSIKEDLLYPMLKTLQKRK